ncbi:hypothetical protein DH2020_033687 [Rehmannia glutinosa]|uniref:Uncharacterized protein n=1 Tax=Rehmannia glutinosa TaxID=99300 RepID=A0ABR0VDW3_REHGL
MISLITSKGPEDANKILSNDGACPICDQVLSKRSVPQKCEVMQEKFTEKLEQVYTAYQKMTKRCQMMEQEIESLSKDKQELQEKFAEKCRQKRKLDEMYDIARTEMESLKRSAIQPANHCFSRQDPDLFSNPSARMDNRDSIRKDWSVFTPDTPGPRRTCGQQDRILTLHSTSLVVHQPNSRGSNRYWKQSSTLFFWCREWSWGRQSFNDS